MATEPVVDTSMAEVLKAVAESLGNLTKLVSTMADQAQAMRADFGPSLTCREFALAVGLSESTVRNRVHDGQIKAEWHGDHCYRIPRAEVEAYRARITRRGSQ